MIPVSVVIPVGPYPHNTRHLDQCLRSVFNQTEKPKEIVLLFNGGDAGVSFNQTHKILSVHRYTNNFGMAGAFNKAIELARYEWVFMLGSDDELYERCLERCWRSWCYHKDTLGWYSVGVRYDSGLEQNTPCLAAMINKSLWRLHGGFDNSEANRNKPDTVMISKMIDENGDKGKTYRVSDEMLYLARVNNR